MATITGNDIMHMLRAAGGALERSRATLNALDSAIGDGDHGAALSAAFAEAISQLDRLTEPTPAEALKTAALALLNTMGGASGALYGSFFLRMSAAAGDKPALAAADFAAMLNAGLEGLTALGKAAPGDKTMIDALAPAATAFAAAGGSIPQAFAAAAQAAEIGALATVGMTAKHGRAKFAGERAVGHVDAGAASISLMFAAFHDYWTGAHHGET